MTHWLCLRRAGPDFISRHTEGEVGGQILGIEWYPVPWVLQPLLRQTDKRETESAASGLPWVQSSPEAHGKMCPVPTPAQERLKCA